jgi:hypothetical protein
MGRHRQFEASRRVAPPKNLVYLLTIMQGQLELGWGVADGWELGEDRMFKSRTCMLDIL